MGEEEAMGQYRVLSGDHRGVETIPATRRDDRRRVRNGPSIDRYQCYSRERSR